MVPHARFTELLSDIEPSSTTTGYASAAQIAIRKHLLEHTNFGPHVVRSFLSGSYTRDTAIRPAIKDGKEKRPDVDIVIVTDFTRHDDPEGVVNSLFWALHGEYNVWRQGRSVGVETSRVDMDVVPIVEESNGSLYIPDRKMKKWIPTNPPGHTDWTTETNRKMGGRFKPLVKMTKWWRRANPTISNRPKGFVIECLAAKFMNPTQAHYGELFVGTLEAIAAAYKTEVAVGTVPFLEDPGVPGNSVMAGMTTDAFVGFCNKAKEHAELGRRALREGDFDRATEMWRRIFGDRFPATPIARPGQPRPAAAAVGALTFPPRATGPVKPTGFA